MLYEIKRNLELAGAVVPCGDAVLQLYVHDCFDHTRPVANATVTLYMPGGEDIPKKDWVEFAQKTTGGNGACRFDVPTGFDGGMVVKKQGLRPVEFLMRDYEYIPIFEMREKEERTIFLTMIDDDAPAPADLDQTVGDFLDNVDVVRVRVEYAANLGHQSAAIAMITRLREIGYDGLIHALVHGYEPEEGSEVSVAEKLKKLRPDFPAIKDLDVTWLKDSGSTQFDSAPGEGVRAIGMVGGCDVKVGSFQNYRENILKVPAALFLQPFNWHQGQRAICTKTIEKTACLPSTSTYLYDVGAMDQEHIASVCSGTGMTEDLLALLSEAESSVDLMVVYGISRRRSGSDPKLVLANLLAGVADAQHGRKTVVLFVHKDNELDNVVTGPALIWTSTPSGTVAAQLNRLTTGQILVVRAQHLPEEVFQQLCKRSKLPIVLEGANTTNLAHLLGKPYLSINSRDTAFPPAISVRLMNVEDAVNEPEGSRSREGLETISHYLSDCRDGVLQAQFQQLQTLATSPHNDQVRMGLYVLAKRLEAEERGLVEQPGVSRDDYKKPAPVAAVADTDSDGEGFDGSSLFD